MKASRFGPIHSATIVCADLDICIEAYRSFLGLEVKDSGKIDTQLADDWQLLDTEGQRYATLGHSDEQSWWLRFIEDSDATIPSPLSTHGWMALEINVKDVDALAETFEPGYFRIVGQPANLAINDNIRAMQVAGEAGELLYLTSINAPCPPFDLPDCSRWIDKIFIPVLSCSSRIETLSFYEALFDTTGLNTDTKITVLNRHFSQTIDHEYPIGLLQLNEASLIEIDEVKFAKSRDKSGKNLAPGIALLTIFSPIKEPKNSKIIFGPNGEGIQFVSRY